MTPFDVAIDRFYVDFIIAVVLSRLVRWLTWRRSSPEKKLWWPNLLTCLAAPLRLGMVHAAEGQLDWEPLFLNYAVMFGILMWYDSWRMKHSERTPRPHP